MEEFSGRKYKLKSSENFDEYMKSLGIGLLSRKAATSVNPVAELIVNEDGSYTFTLTTFLRVIVNTFKLNEEFVEERADGEKVNTIVTMEGNKVIQTQVDKNGRKSVHVREFTPDFLTVTSTVDGWDGKCIRIYESI